MATGFGKLFGLSPLGMRVAASVSRSLSTTVPANAAAATKAVVPVAGSEVSSPALSHHEQMLASIEEERILTQLPPLKPSGEVTVHEFPERDLVNYPRLEMPLYGGRTRLGFVPEEWFDFFYRKTGVSGPYVFGVGLITTLLSKELWVADHDMPLIIPGTVFIYLLTTKLGPMMAAYADKGIDEEEESLIEIQEDAIRDRQKDIKTQEESQWMAKGQYMLFDAKRENVKIQLEAEFRRRQMEVYKDVKKRLDYQIEMQNARRSVEKRHMINWIVNSILKSIDEKQEKRNIDQCIANLKKLAPA